VAQKDHESKTIRQFFLKSPATQIDTVNRSAENFIMDFAPFHLRQSTTIEVPELEDEF